MSTRVTMVRAIKPMPLALSEDSIERIINELIGLSADAFAIFLKSKTYYWHFTGPHFRDHRSMLEKQAGELLKTIDAIAGRARKLGGPSLRSISQVSDRQRIRKSDGRSVETEEILGELLNDHEHFTLYLRKAHELVFGHDDVATAAAIAGWIDESECRVWFLGEILR